ncbi:hypothetical protein [Lactobacillus crispatus]|uniref:hypothetical protein n=1 Tax=Lactobacillus crispatus TaxID=47770 RepID=UPI0022AC0337|nr:hypothetical protein [Lactobacillus crispatus]MCZ3592510.1 hypothetical protein [Lactobacillus crispatus]MCZ3601151.1 hypothetical protein [Lactobacillus crispatus]MDK7331454.1 hypothetical protein [Lactobacillus crispatus]MDK8154180.1 hypothetical protein [Lactobacillus crispatus]
MKVKVFDTSLEGRGHAIGSFTLEDLMNNWLHEHKNVDIKSVHMQECLNGQLMVLVMYEEKRNRYLQQRKFNLSEGEDPNEFMKNHYVVNVSTLRDEDWDELITVVTYEDEDNDKA